MPKIKDLLRQLAANPSPTATYEQSYQGLTKDQISALASRG